MEIKPSTIAELAKNPYIVGVKQANGNISSVAQIAQMCDIDIYSGNDDQIVPILSLGGKGVISVLSNILPQQTHDIVAKWLAGDPAGSLALQLQWLEEMCIRDRRNDRAQSAAGEIRLPKHGLARTAEWTLEAGDKQSVTFRLDADENTRKGYPYDFTLRVCYRLYGACVTAEYTAVSYTHLHIADSEERAWAVW